MSEHVCSEMYALMKRLADTYQQILEEHAEASRSEGRTESVKGERKNSSLFDVRSELRDHQSVCVQCRRTMQRISMQSSGRTRVA